MSSGLNLLREINRFQCKRRPMSEGMKLQAQEEAKHDSEENEPVMMNPQDMIDDFESANAKKVQIISKIESRMKAKDKLLDQRH